MDLFLKIQAQQMQLVQTYLELIILKHTIGKIWFHSLVGIGAVLPLRGFSLAVSAFAVRIAIIILGFGLLPILRDLFAAMGIAAKEK